MQIIFYCEINKTMGEESWWFTNRFKISLGVSIVLMGLFAFLAYYLIVKQDGWMIAGFVGVFVFGMIAVYCYSQIDRENKSQEEIQNHCEQVSELRRQFFAGDRSFARLDEIEEVLKELRQKNSSMGLRYQKDVQSCESGLKLEWLLRQKKIQLDRGNSSNFKELDRLIDILANTSDENKNFVAQESARLSPRPMSFRGNPRRHRRKTTK